MRECALQLSRIAGLHDTERSKPRRRKDGHMALPFDETQGARDPRALAILAKTIYRELRASGYAERDVMTLASELLGMVATEVKGRRTPSDA
jgi:hypothetical protein